MFEHTVRFLFVQHEHDEGHRMSTRPIPESLWGTPEYQQYFEQMGGQGWELVSVTPLLGGEYDVEYGSYSIALPYTKGYYFFWKRSA